MFPVISGSSLIDIIRRNFFWEDRYHATAIENGRKPLRSEVKLIGKVKENLGGWAIGQDVLEGEGKY